jgi:predicted secreted protein
MRPLRSLMALVLALCLTTPAFAQAGDDGHAWRELAQKLEGGVAVDMRLRDGHHFKATFIGAQDATIVVQRKTRVPVPVDEIPYDAIASLSRVQAGSISAGKIAGIALGSAGAAIGVLWLIALASFD